MQVVDIPTQLESYQVVFDVRVVVNVIDIVDIVARSGSAEEEVLIELEESHTGPKGQNQMVAGLRRNNRIRLVFRRADNA